MNKKTLKDFNVKGKKVLEIGCGYGDISVHLAMQGAIVTALDNTHNALRNAQILAEKNGVSIHPVVMDAMNIDHLKDEKYDYVVGQFILHHIEPFDLFVTKLDALMAPGTVGLFFENSSSNKLLMFFRKTLVGRFGIPKHSDGVEVPFQRKEFNLLKRCFTAKRTTPSLYFWELLSTYIFRKSEKAKRFFRAMDAWFYKYLPFFRRLSYYQVIYFKK